MSVSSHPDPRGGGHCPKYELCTNPSVLRALIISMIITKNINRGELVCNVYKDTTKNSLSKMSWFQSYCQKYHESKQQSLGEPKQLMG